MVIKKKVKHMARDAMTVGITGVGLGVMGGAAGMAGSSAGAGAIGKMGKGLGIAGSAMMMGHTIGILNDTLPKKKKGRRF